MASIMVRNLDEDLKRRLRIRAAENGRSMEQEVREILRVELTSEAMPVRNLGLAASIWTFGRGPDARAPFERR